MEIAETVKKLCGASGVSGFEAEMIQVVSEMLGHYCSDISADSLGNITAWKKCGNPEAKTILLDAHIDQIGFIVTEVLEDGFLRVRSIGGTDPWVLHTCGVNVLSSPSVKGILAYADLPGADDAMEVYEKRLFIDTGLDYEQARRLIPVGTPVVFDGDMCRLSENIIAGRALDNRCGFAAILKALDNIKNIKLKNTDIAICGSALEETGGAGIKTAAFKVLPSQALVIDMTHAKTPDAPRYGTFEMGSGCAIGAGPNISTKIMKRLISCAEKNKLKYEIEVMEGNTGTNAWVLQTSCVGVPCGLVSIPLRYMHTPIEAVNLNDVSAVAELISSYIKLIDREGFNYA